MERDLTTGSVFKTVIYFSLPYLLSYFLQTLYGMADLFIVGQFGGVSSTTAVSIGSQIMHMLTVMIVGLAMGATVMIGRCIGAKDYKKASETIGNTATMFMGIAIILMIVLLAAVRPIVSVMSTPAEAVEGTIRYLTICFIGIPFITAYNIISAIFRGIGDSKSPMYFIAVARSEYRSGLSVHRSHGTGCGRSSTWNDHRTGSQCHCFTYRGHKKGHRDQIKKIGSSSEETYDEKHIESRCAGCTAGWIYPDIVYCNHNICQPAWIK